MRREKSQNKLYNSAFRSTVTKSLPLKLTDTPILTVKQMKSRAVGMPEEKPPDLKDRPTKVARYTSIEQIIAKNHFSHAKQSIPPSIISKKKQADFVIKSSKTLTSFMAKKSTATYYVDSCE